MDGVNRLIATIAAAFAMVQLSWLPGSAHADPLSLREKLNILQQTYPTAIISIGSSDILLSDGTRLPVDDGKRKSHREKLKKPDIEDTLAQIYPVAPCHIASPPRNFDPGRIRHEGLLRHLYGNTQAEARASLTTIDWFGKPLPVTTRHGVDKALIKVRDALANLPGRYRIFFIETAGTFNWRVIAGTNRLSVHSFGAAIDINVKFANYWRWSGGRPGNVPAYENKIPQAIVETFERHGFIWGGKWYHFDTMHFEYRPELIAIARRAAQSGCTQ